MIQHHIYKYQTTRNFMKLVKDLVSVYTNKKNNQIKLELKKKSLKELGFKIDDLLNTPLQKEIKKFKRGNK